MKIQRVCASIGVLLSFVTVVGHTQGKKVRAVITGISVGFPQDVLALASNVSVNLPTSDGGLGLSSLADEHSTVIPIKTFARPLDLQGGGNDDYLFFDSGNVVVQGKPDASGVWHLEFASGYGAPLPGDPNAIFIAPVRRTICPNATAATFDETFDLNYANPGSVLIDPADPTHSTLFMIYEGTNLCIGNSGGRVANATNHFYSTIGVATAEPGSYGEVWPYYDYPGNAVPPNQVRRRTGRGPRASQWGEFGSILCYLAMPASNCHRLNSPATGRYPVLTPSETIDDAMQAAWANPDAPVRLPQNLGDSAPSAFIDDGASGNVLSPYVYAVYNTSCDPSSFSHCPGPDSQGSSISVARALLSPGLPLQFFKWFNGSFASATMSNDRGVFTNDGLGVTPSDQSGSPRGGLNSPLFPVDPSNSIASRQTCQGTHQNQSMGSISYVDATHQYVLTFVCTSPSDPNPDLNPTPFTNGCSTGPLSTNIGRAWFYAVSDALESGNWSAPAEIANTWEWGCWNQQYRNGSPTYCIYSGWYPSFMSRWPAEPGHLKLTGFAFSTNGCTDAPAGVTPPRPRAYQSRTFTITIGPSSS